MQKHIHQEEEALTALLKGQVDGLDYFFLRYHGPLTYFAHNLICNRDLAEDLVEDTFLKLWERRTVLGAQGSLRSWLYTSVRNACIDHMRKEKRKVVYLTETKAAGENEDRTVLHRIIEAETMHQVYMALQTLPPRCGQVFHMYYLEEKSLQEIAAELNLSLSTVKSQKGRALELLRKKLPHLTNILIFPML